MISSPSRFPWGLVAALSVAQLISWGTIFYAFTLFMDPMSDELGWSKPQLTAAYSLGLAASGVGAVPVGRLIDRGHGTVVMTAGSLFAAVLFWVWSRLDSYALFVAVWIGLGFCMSATLYEPGFAVLTRHLGAFARRAITAMTLVGGLASTAFIPITHVLIDHFGWRGALLALAAVNGLVCAAIHAVVIPREAPRHAASKAASASTKGEASRVLGSIAFWGFVATAMLQGALFTGFAVHLIPLLVERGFSIEAAVAAFALIGPAQVAARIVIALSERAASMRTIGLITMAISLAPFALLPLIQPGAWLVAVFALLYGAANGMMTVLRAVLPIEIFGRADYGTIQGMIAGPAIMSRAAGPFLLGLIWAWNGGYGAVIWMGLATAVLMLICFTATVYGASSHAPAE